MPYLQSVRRSVSFSSRFSYDFDFDRLPSVGGCFEYLVHLTERGRRVQYLADLFVFADQDASCAVLCRVPDVD